MPKRTGTGKAQTPGKQKRIIKIKRKSTVPEKPAIQSQPKVFPKKQAPKAKVYSFIGTDGKEYSLTPLQFKFVDAMLGLDKTGFEAVIEAGYNVFNDEGKINKNLCWSIATENLSKPAILEYLRTELQSVKMTKESMMIEMSFLAFQRFDLKTKAKAIDMFWKMIGEYAPEKHEHKLDAEIKEALGKVASLVD